VSDVTRARIVLQTGTQIKDLVNRLTDGMELSVETRAPVYPSMRAALKEKEEADLAAGVQPGPTVLQVNCMFMDNKFDHLDPTHFRFALLQIEVAEKLGVNFVSIFCELEVHFHEILTLGQQSNGVAIEHYNFFRQRLKGSVPVAELDRLLEEKLIFLVDATGIPVLLSLLVLIFTSGGEDLTKLPSNRIELYEIGIDSAVSKRLLPGNRTSTDLLIHDWLRLFNLDRSALTQTVDVVGPAGGDAKGGGGDQKERKEREHRPTRKAALSMELANNTDFNEKKVQPTGAGANALPSAYKVIRLHDVPSLETRKRLMAQVHDVIRQNYGSYADSEPAVQWLDNLAKSGLNSADPLCKLLVTMVVDANGGGALGFSSAEVFPAGDRRYI
jgi:hypothetical protein